MCREKPGLSLKTRALYKNDKKLIDLGKKSSFHINHAGLKDSGEYRCIGSGTHCCASSSDAVRIQVQGEAFIICEEGSWEGRSLRWSRRRRGSWGITKAQGSFPQAPERVQACFALKSTGVVSPPLCSPCSRRPHTSCASLQSGSRPHCSGACCDSSLQSCFHDPY